MFEWLFGRQRRTEADALREEVDFLRAHLGRQEKLLTDRIKDLETANSELRRELIAVCNSGAQAAIEAYRYQAKQPPRAAEAPAGTNGRARPAAGGELWEQGYTADGVMSPDSIPSDDDVALEEQAKMRERLRLQGSDEPELEDEPS